MTPNLSYILGACSKGFLTLLYRKVFLFGPVGTGKTTFLKGFFRNKPHRWIDLLDAQQMGQVLCLSWKEGIAKIFL